MAFTAYSKGADMNRDKAEGMITRLLNNAEGIKFGSVSISANLHNGRIMNVVYSTTENTRENETTENTDNSVKSGA